MPRASAASPAPTAQVPRFTADRTSPVPLYFQAAQHLEDAIISGVIPPGTVFENELVLAEQLGVSRPTMRRAMQHIVEKGLIVRRRGVGTRVVQPKVRRQLELTSLYEDLAGTGQSPTTRVITFEALDCDEELAARLAVPVGTPALRLVRLRSARDQPIAQLTNYLPERLVTFDAADLEGAGLYQLLRAQGIQLHSAAQTVSARNATTAEARLLTIAKGEALLTMQRVTYDDHGDVVEFGTHLYVASRYAFEINLLSP